MKIIYKVNDKVTLEHEVKNHQDIFEFLSSMGEVLSNDQCKACDNKNVRFVVREVQKDKMSYIYYECRCLNHECRARLSFGVFQDGHGLFPKRKDGDGNWLPNNGWTRWTGNKE